VGVFLGFPHSFLKKAIKNFKFFAIFDFFIDCGKVIYKKVSYRLTFLGKNVFF